MRSLLLPAILACTLLGAAASAQNNGAPRSCADVMLPATLGGKIILGHVADARSGQLSDASIPTVAEAAALKTFRDAPCRADTISNMRGDYPREAALEDGNTRILNDLIARKISFGAANRQWAQARFDYLRLTGAILQQQTQSAPLPYVQPYVQPDVVQPNQNGVMTPEERARLDAQGAADRQRLLDDAIRNRNNSLGLCPSGLPPGQTNPANPASC